MKDAKTCYQTDLEVFPYEGHDMLNRSPDGPCLENRNIFCVIPGFRREVDEIRALLGCYAASSGNSIATFGVTYRSGLQGSRHLEDETDRLSRNVDKELPLIAA